MSPLVRPPSSAQEGTSAAPATKGSRLSKSRLFIVTIESAIAKMFTILKRINDHRVTLYVMRDRVMSVARGDRRGESDDWRAKNTIDLLRSSDYTTPHMAPLYEGKAKRLYATEDPNVLRMEYKDDATAFNAEKKAQFENKGKLNKAITLLIYKMLEDRGIETHIVEDIDETNILVKKVDILLVEVIVRNIAAGGFSKRMGVEEGTPFETPIVEFSYKSDELGDPLINTDYARELGLATPEECAELKRQALEINEVQKEFFDKCGLTLVDFKIEFGRPTDEPSKIILADEVSPDTCRLWDKETGEKLDKDRFRQDLGGVMEGYAEVLQRIEKASS